jgi:citrate lyase subunit beta/citryl-CoA lyase
MKAQSAPLDEVRLSPARARSWLLPPATRFPFVSTAPADKVILDLEDGIAAADRGDAREADLVLTGEHDSLWVRINPCESADWQLDLEALHDCPELGGVVLAKTETGEQVGRTVAALGSEPSVIALVETAAALLNLTDIVRAAPARLALGSGDFGRDTRSRDDSPTLTAARVALVLASAASGLPAPIDGPTAGDDETVLRRSEYGRSLGMGGKLCLRPSHAAPINVGMSPSGPEISAAEQILERASRADRRKLPPQTKVRKAVLADARAFDLR